LEPSFDSGPGALPGQGGSGSTTKVTNVRRFAIDALIMQSLGGGNL
jgi:hypothetical protein